MVVKEFELRANLGDATKQLDYLNNELAEAKKLTQDWEKELFDLEKQLKNVPKNNLAEQKRLRDEIAKQKDLIKEQKFAVKDLTTQQKEQKTVVKNLTEEQRDYSGATSLADKATGGLFSKLGYLKKSITGVTKGLNLMKIAILGTGIGALVIAVTSLIQAFKRSEEGQKKFKKIMSIIGSVVGNVLDIFANLGEKIISVFTDPKQALIDFKDALKENITNRFNALLKTVGFLGSAIKKVFSGEFKEALDDVKSAGSSAVDAFTGVENTIDKTTKAVKDFSKEVIDDAKKAGAIADQRAKAEIKARDLLIERAKADQKIAELREKAADKEKFSAQERIEFIKEAGKISEEIAQKEIEVAKLNFEAKKAENALAKSTTEDLNEQAQLQAEVIAKETARLRLQKALTAELTTARREDQAEQERIRKEQEAKDKEKEAKEKERLTNIQKIRDDFTQRQKEKEAETEAEKVALEEEKALAELDRLNATEEQKLEVINYYKGLKAEADQKDADNEKKLADDVTKAKLDIAKRGLGLIGEIAGKGSKVGKAVALAQATISGIEGVQNAFKTAQDSPITTVFPAYPFIQAGLAGAFSAMQIAKIKSTDPSGKSTPSVAGGGGGGGATAPSFNIVGATETSQLADAVAGQEQQPVQAYVVANDVTTAQSLENNIVEGATL